MRFNVSSNDEGGFVKSIDSVISSSLLRIPRDFLDPNAFPNASTAYQEANSSGFLFLAFSTSFFLSDISFSEGVDDSCLSMFNDEEYMMFLRLIIVDGGDVLAGAKDEHECATRKNKKNDWMGICIMFDAMVRLIDEIELGPTHPRMIEFTFFTYGLLGPEFFVSVVAVVVVRQFLWACFLTASQAKVDRPHALSDGVLVV